MRTIIPGPPGTGKTHRLVNVHLKKELYEYKTRSEKIAYITFSNAATNEAKKRIKNLYPSFSFPYITTMHSLGTKTLNIDTNTQLLEGKNWNGFKNFSGVCYDLNFEKKEWENGYKEYKNNYMKIIEYAKNKKLELVNAAIELDILDYVDENLLEQIYQDLLDYKSQFGMFEFSDMISKFVEKNPSLSLDVVFLDEAQDLSPLQWDMFHCIEQQCKRSYIAGDDDQTIYSFQGASPKNFIELKGTIDARTISRRVPRAVHRLAVSILENIDERLVKTWEPRDEEGSVIYGKMIEDIDFNQGEWMILTRTNEQMEPIVEHLQTLGLRFDCKINNLLPPKFLEAIRIWDRLNKGATVSGEEAQIVYSFLTKKELKRNFGSGRSLDNVDTVDLDTLILEHGLTATGDWTVLSCSEQQEAYIKYLIQNGEDLTKKSRIKVSTIHGVKGEEADNVILFTDLEPIIMQSAYRDKDTEHRLFFVGVTRAKQNLFIMDQDYEHQYPIGEDIV
jgi:superfamily I DNA/RNA helicase